MAVHGNNIEQLRKAGLYVSDKLSPKVAERIDHLDANEVNELIALSHKICDLELPAREAASSPRAAVVGIQGSQTEER